MVYRFIARNTSILTLPGFKEQHLFDTMWPDLLNTLSEAELEAHTVFHTKTLENAFLDT